MSNQVKIQMPKAGTKINAMSVDVEDYFQVWALSTKITRDDWDKYPLRVEQTMHRILDMFDDLDVKSTFFTLSWVAEKCPALIKEIVNRGHELGSHGIEHVKVFDQSADEFAVDCGTAKKRLEDIGGTAVIGYRAAGFSIDTRTPWAHEVLAEQGYAYSSSLHPIAHDHYNMPDAPRFHFNVFQDLFPPKQGRLEEAKRDFFHEIPVSTMDEFGRRFSCAGGGWFRLLPYAWTKHLIDKMQKQDGQPAVFYFHPWEIDADQPRVKDIPLKSTIRHYTNLAVMEKKLRRLCADYKWDRIDKVFSVNPIN